VRLSKFREVRPQLCACSNAEEMGVPSLVPTSWNDTHKINAGGGKGMVDEVIN
jgi:hypothetical protein